LYKINSLINLKNVVTPFNQPGTLCYKRVLEEMATSRIRLEGKAVFQQHNPHHQKWVKPLWHNGLTLAELKG